ncbi:HAD-like domain-containing protein [Microdochium bolleyi]|uniref:HAD-like domain-containing protein n=1 Tax=Microdochium bolleyi TaxID=196109 RepID=A0A136IS98_9PEZI|nr:HAD-like domain-containing protein [Microdochium bolleyi]
MDQVKALTFDVFGTVVDWRTTVVRELVQAARDKLASPPPAPSPSSSAAAAGYFTRLASLAEPDWARFAQSWRDSYGVFTRSFVPGETAWKDIDAHHYDSLVALLVDWGLGSRGAEQDVDNDDDNDGNSGSTAAAAETAEAVTTVYTEPELRNLSLVWHRLRPWPDSAAGIHLLGTRYATATLSNGTRALLSDLNSLPDPPEAEGPKTGLGFQHIISTADFAAYKPHPSTYRGACAALGCQPHEVAMVAAHPGDLRAARAQGMRTIYVERPREEEWSAEEERYREAKGEGEENGEHERTGWVDIWISEAEGGFLEVARRLGVASSSSSSSSSVFH